jgi:hypothetical protein
MRTMPRLISEGVDFQGSGQFHVMKFIFGRVCRTSVIKIGFCEHRSPRKFREVVPKLNMAGAKNLPKLSAIDDRGRGGRNYLHFDDRWHSWDPVCDRPRLLVRRVLVNTVDATECSLVRETNMD